MSPGVNLYRRAIVYQMLSSSDILQGIGCIKRFPLTGYDTGLYQPFNGRFLSLLCQHYSVPRLFHGLITFGTKERR